MRKLILFILLSFGFSLHAGDASEFVNLGFSNDGSYFMFGQHGIIVSTSESYSESFIIDIHTNRYAKGGKFLSKWQMLPGLGADSIGGLFNQVRENSWIVKKYHINHINNGKAVYFLVDGEVPKNDLTFRIFDKKTKVKNISCELKQGKSDTKGKVESWFFIEINWTDLNDEKHQNLIGHPKYKRNNVLDYYIKNIILSPDHKTLIFVIAKEVKVKDGVNLRYMVETVVLY